MGQTVGVRIGLLFGRRSTYLHAVCCISLGNGSTLLVYGCVKLAARIARRDADEDGHLFRHGPFTRMPMHGV